MGKHISAIKARGATILGNHAVLKVLLVSIGLTIVAFIIVAMTLGSTFDNF